MQKKIQDSVVVAVENQGDSVRSLYDEAVAVLSGLGRSFELFFVDDASTDHTWQTLKALADADPRVRVLRMRSRFGEASALEAGVRHSVGERVVFLSARVNVNMKQVPDLLNALEHGSDFVVGRRYPRRDALINRWVSGFFNRMVNGICHLDLHDINSGVFASRRDVLERISVYGDLNNFLAVLAAQQGYRVSEVPIEQRAGSFRVSRYPGEYIRRFLDIIAVFFLTRYSKKPLHFMGFFGALFFGLGAVIELYLFIYRILQLGPIAGRPLLIVGALFLIIGIQMISIGLLGEMIIFTHAGDIEEYNIEEIIGDETQS